MINTPYGVGNSINDCQYFPRLTRSEMEAIVNAVSPATDTDIFWSVGLTRAQIFAISWRVRQWRWTGTWSATASVAGGANDGSTASFSGSVAQTPVPTDLIRRGGPSGGTQIIGVNSEEPLLVSTPNQVPRTPPRYATELPYSTLKSRGLVRSGTGASGFSINALDNSPWANYGGTIPRDPIHFVGLAGAIDGVFMNTLQVGFGIGFDIMVFESDMFFPYIDFVIASNNFGGIFLSSHGSRALPDIPVVGAGLVTVKPIIAPDFSFPLFLTSEYTGPGDETIDAGASLNLTLTAIEFHPFRNRLGQLVWNSTSGAQIASPFA